MSFVALGGGRSPQSSAIRRSVETTSFGYSSKTPRTVRGFGPRNVTDRAPDRASSGPRIQKSIRSHPQATLSTVTRLSTWIANASTESLPAFDRRRAVSGFSTKGEAMKARIAILALAAVLLALAAATLSPSARGEPVSESVLPPGGQPYGQTYSEWAADWWVWALSQPTPTNPLLDNTGRRCAEGQTGAVWFLAGTFAGTASRKCTVSAN